MVKGVFDSVTDQYDLMNDLMSLRMHRLWKDMMVSMIPFRDGIKCLDVGGGTGDIAFRIQTELENSGLTGSIDITDINHSMLKAGVDRQIDELIEGNFSWFCANAEHVPAPDNSYDTYTIAFCIRNVTNIDAALKEAHRVLKPGGKFLCLEFSHLDNDVLQKCYDAYSFNIIPKMGKWVVDDEASYQYLVESIRCFPNRSDFAEMITQAGFSQVVAKPLLHGVVAIHTGWKI